MRLLTNRFCWRLALVYGILVAGVCLGLGGYLVNAMEDQAYTDLQQHTEAEARLVAQLVAPALVEDPSVDAIDELSAVLDKEIGARITIVGIAGSPLGDSAMNPVHMDNQLKQDEFHSAALHGVGRSIRFSNITGAKTLYVAVPVQDQNNRLGFIRVAASTGDVERTVELAWLAVAATTIAALLLTLGLGIWYRRRLRQQVEKLKVFADRVSEGELDDKVWIAGNTELDSLGSALNQMTRTIRDRLVSISEGKIKLEAVLRSMPNGVIFINRKGQIDLVNPAAEKVLSFTRRECRGMPHDAVIRNPELAAGINEALQGNHVVEQEIRIAYPEEVLFDVSISPIYDQKGSTTGVVAVLRDITEKHRLARMRRDFVANVSHELKTPVTAIKGFTETILDGALNDPKACREFLEIIDAEADRLKRLIYDLLDLSRIEAKQVRLDRVPVDMSAMIHDTIVKLGGQIQQAELIVEIKSPDRQVIVDADRDLVYQVLVNLVENALKYTPAKGRIEVELAEKANDVVVWVRDNGLGIPPEDIDRVFERFYRVDKARSRTRGGTGLGLSIVKHIVDIHGGTVGVNSRPGRGSEFFFTLPKKAPQ